MATIINHNIEAINSYRNLWATNAMLAKSLERLSSGLRINRASDDAAGLQISEKMRGQIVGLNAAIKNALDGISLIRVAEGAMTEMSADLIRMRELSVLASTDVLTSTDRLAYQNEFLALQKHVERIATTTEFNTRVLLDGSLSATVGVDRTDYTFRGQVTRTDQWSARRITIQIGANVGQAISLGICSLRVGSWASDAVPIISANTMNYQDGAWNNGADVNTFDFPSYMWAYDMVGGLNIAYSGATTGDGMFGTIGYAVVINDDTIAGGQLVGDVEAQRAVVGREYSNQVYVHTRGAIDIKTVSNAQTSLWRVEQAIRKVSQIRARLGSIENSLNSAVNSLQIAVENTQAAESRIRDADMALEMTMFTRNQVLAQAGMAMLAQANMQPQNVLSLLR